MTRARIWGVALMLLCAAAALYGLFLGAFSLFLGPVGTVVGAAIGLPLLGLTWLWIRRSASPRERRMLGLIGAAWLLLLAAFAAMLSGLGGSLLQSELALVLYFFFPCLPALVLFFIVASHWRRLPRHEALSARGSP